MVDKVEAGFSFRAAVVAEDGLLPGGERGGEGEEAGGAVAVVAAGVRGDFCPRRRRDDGGSVPVPLEERVEHPPVGPHVPHGPAADGARVGAPGPLLEAVRVHVVT